MQTSRLYYINNHGFQMKKMHGVPVEIQTANILRGDQQLGNAAGYPQWVGYGS